MRNHIYVDGTDLATFGVYCSGQGTFSAPKREYTYYDVPGRDGSLLGVSTRLQNIEVSYDCFIYTNFDENIRNLRSFLLSRLGYVRIEDTYDTTHFRLGIYEGELEPAVTMKNNAAQFTLTFNCRPERWMKSGETVTTATPGSINGFENPTLFVAKPFLRVYGYGQFTLVTEDSTVRPSVYKSLMTVFIDDTSTEYVDIDCETMNCYYGDTNLASYVGFQDAATTNFGVDAPTFGVGVTSMLSFATDVSPNLTKIEVTPRWWEV